MGQNFKTNVIFGAILPTFSKISCLRCFSIVHRSWIVNYINPYKFNRSMRKLCSIRKTFSKRTFSSIQYSKLFMSNRSLGKQSSISLVEWVYVFKRIFFRVNIYKLPKKHACTYKKQKHILGNHVIFSECLPCTKIH